MIAQLNEHLSIRCGKCGDMWITPEGKYTCCLDCPNKTMVDLERDDQSDNAHLYESESGEEIGITYHPPLTAKDIVAELMKWMEQIEEQKKEALKLAFEALFKSREENQKKKTQD